MDADKIKIKGTHEHGYYVAGWQDGLSTAHVVWRGTDDGATFERDVTSIRELLCLVGAIHLYENTELISAVMS